MSLYVFLAGITALLVAWFFWSSRRLSSAEIGEFARRRRVVAIEKHYAFSEGQVGVDLDFKRLMAAQGKFYRLDEALSTFRSIAAALLKWKKHEWLVFAYARTGRVLGIWLNKGPDNEKVWPLVGVDALAQLAEKLGADTVLDFHNHPNPNPRRLLAFPPSGQDQIHADHFGTRFVSMGMSYLAFVAERGRHYQYACWVPDTLLPLQAFHAEVEAKNGTSRLANLRLRSEHRAHTRLALLLRYEHASDNLGAARRHVEGPMVSPATTPRSPNPSPTQIPPVAPISAPVPTLKLIPVRSSNLLAIGYESGQQILQVAFHSGCIYQYFGVPEGEYLRLMNAESKGSYFNSRIVHGGYRYVQIA